eukprot:scaffold69219_cov68-Phaeocystis_antarctica.AAC.1
MLLELLPCRAERPASVAGRLHPAARGRRLTAVTCPPSRFEHGLRPCLIARGHEGARALIALPRSSALPGRRLATRGRLRPNSRLACHRVYFFEAREKPGRSSARYSQCLKSVANSAPPTTASAVSWQHLPSPVTLCRSAERQVRLRNASRSAHYSDR